MATYKKRTLITILLCLMVFSAFFLIFSLNIPSASAVNEAELCITSNASGGMYWQNSSGKYNVARTPRAELQTDIDNSSAVLIRNYSFNLTVQEYSEITSGYNHLVFAYGRKDLMDAIYEHTWDKNNKEFSANAKISEEALNTYVIKIPGYFDFTVDALSHFNEPANFFQKCKEHDPTDTLKIITINQEDYYLSYDYSTNVAHITIPIAWSEGNLYDIGIYHFFYYSTIFGKEMRTIGYGTDSVLEEVKTAVKHASSYSQPVIGAYEKALGIYRAGNTGVSYKYISMKSGHFNQYDILTESITIPAVYIPDENYVLEQIIKKRPNQSVSDFNAVFTSTAGFEMSDNQIGEKETFGSRIIRQATGLNYKYNEGDKIPAVVEVDVEYGPYLYSNFFIRISNSGNPDEFENSDYKYFQNDLDIDVWPTEVSLKNGKVYLYFDYNHIFNLFNNTLFWAIQEGFDLTIPEEIPAYVTVQEETLSAENKRLVVSVDEGHQESLFGLEIVGNAPITPATKMDCTVIYEVLNEDLTVTEKQFNVGEWYDCRFGELCAELLNEEHEIFSQKIYGSLKPAILGEVEYIKPVNVLYGSETLDYVNKTALLKIEYEYTSNVCVISNNLNSDKYVVSLSPSIVDYSLEILGIKERIPAGYRVASFEPKNFTVREAHPENALKTIFNINSIDKDSQYYSIKLHLSDKWPVNFKYYTRFKNTPFFSKTNATKSVKVLDYADIFALTTNDVKSILQIDDLTLLGLANVQKVDVKFDEDLNTYNVELIYTEASLKKTNVDGSFDEVKVPLTAYKEWTNSFGKDWSILMLNDTENHYFQYANDVALEDLYGFFSVALFEERVSDLNYWLRDYKGDGCKTVFTVKQVSGSDVYKFFGERKMYISMAISEWFNREDKLLYSYFFYLDGSSDLNYLALNGADNYDDNQSAISNRIEDIGDSVSNFFNNTPLGIALKIAFFVAVGITVLGLLWWLIRLFFKKKKE